MRSGLYIIAFLATCQTCFAQSQDQKAWNAVWDRLNKVLPESTSSESVHALRVIVPATWAKRDRAGLRELQTYAGAVPDDSFSIDPSRMKLLLHDAYARFVLDVDLPTLDEKQSKAFEAAKLEYQRAFDAFLKRLNEYETLWEKRQADLLRRGEKIDTTARLDFRQDMSGFFSGVQGQLDSVSTKIQKFAPLNNHWNNAVRAIRDEIDNARSDIRGIYTYFGGEATLDAIKSSCTEGGAGWDTLTFNSSVNSASMRSSNWNANGSWSGSFFSLDAGGGGSSYDKMISGANESVELKFCNLSYISLRPGDWFDVSFLQAIDSGEVSLKSGSSSARFVENGKKILGPNGSIPRLVKGAIVARSIQFSATMDDSKLTEMRKNSAGNAGIRIGPWRIGGSGGSTEFKSENTSQKGTYSRSTASEVPVILAIITEPTK